jgi:hypothetical protein
MLNKISKIEELRTRIGNDEVDLLSYVKQFGSITLPEAIITVFGPLTINQPFLNAALKTSPSLKERREEPLGLRRLHKHRMMLYCSDPICDS